MIVRPLALCFPATSATLSPFLKAYPVLSSPEALTHGLTSSWATFCST